MDCPKCGQRSPAGAAECPACGIIFDRYSPNRSSSRDMWVPPPPQPEPKRDSGNGILMAAGLFMIGMIVVAIYMKKNGTKVPQFVEDGAMVIIGAVGFVAVLIYKYMVVKNARL